MDKRKILGNVLSTVADIATTVLFVETLSDLDPEDVISP